MTRKKKTEAQIGTSETTSPSDAAPGDPAPDQNGYGEKPAPAFKVGPIPTDRSNAVAAAVWENTYTANGDGRTFTVYNVTVEARYYDANHENEDGSKSRWKSSKQFRGSQIYALMYCLQRCSDWICARRDPQQKPQEEHVPF